MRFVGKSASKAVVVTLVVALVLVAALLVGCGSKQSADKPVTDTPAAEKATELSGVLAVEGSDTMVNLAQAWAETFMNENTGVMLTVKGGGSGAGIASLINTRGTYELTCETKACY